MTTLLDECKSLQKNALDNLYTLNYNCVVEELMHQISQSPTQMIHTIPFNIALLNGVTYCGYSAVADYKYECQKIKTYIINKLREEGFLVEEICKSQFFWRQECLVIGWSS